MKTMKKLMAILLAAIMTMAMAVTAFAADGTTANTKTGTLTVKVTGNQTNLKGQTISLYKLFDVTKNGEHYGYKVNSVYKKALRTVLNLNDSATDDDYYDAVSKLSETAGSEGVSTIQKFANDFTKELLTENPMAQADYSSKDTTFTADDSSYDFTNVEYGYYLVFQNDSKTIQSSLVTVAADKTEVELKSEAPSIEKTADVGTVKIGQTVTYTIKGAVPDMTGYDNYVYKIHDTLTNGLDFVTNDDKTKVAVTVKIGGQEVAEIKTADFVDENGAVTTTPSKSMVLDLSTAVKEKTTGDEIEVTYQATVNENAVVTTNNSATLEYSNNPGTNSTGTSEPSKVVTPTYPLDIKKIATDEKDVALKGAKFSLYKESEADENLIKVVKDTNGYRVAKDSEQESALSEFESTDTFTDGHNLHVNGLEAGTYYLKETQAPDGYNKLEDAVKVVITKTSDTEWTVSQNDETKEDKIITVENSTGSVLPRTGGKGTIAFAVVAVLLILGVAVSFMNDKRKARR